MINVIAVDSIRTLPMAATYGYGLVTLYTLAAIAFFIPVALITAELATTWPEKGGIYAWVKLAFGPKWGLCVVYLQWIYNVVWYPAILTLIASTVAFLFNPTWVSDPTFITSTVLITFWGCTLLNFFGMRISSAVSTVGSILGTLGPMILIILLAVAWIKQGNTVEITPSWQSFFPKIKGLAEWVFFTQIIFSLMGLEMSSVHALEVENPKKDYPAALVISVFIIIISLILASLAVALVVPAKALHNLTGIIQAFHLFATAFETPWLAPLVAGAIVIGGVCQVATWIIGPTKGLFAAADDGLLPHVLAKTNRFGVPYMMLITQGVLASLLTLVYVLLPSVDSAYFALSAMAAQFAMFMYVILFCAAIALRYSQAQVTRSFKIPGKNWGIWLAGLSGILVSIAVIVLGFVPPQDKVNISDVMLYEVFLILGMVAMLIPIVCIHTPRRLQKKSV